MEAPSNTVFPVSKTFFEFMPKPFRDQADANTLYVGYASIGVGEEDAGWMIEKHVTSSNVTKVTYPNASMKFEFKCIVVSVDKDGKYAEVRSTIGSIDYIPTSELKKDAGEDVPKR